MPSIADFVTAPKLAATGACLLSASCLVAPSPGGHANTAITLSVLSLLFAACGWLSHVWISHRRLRALHSAVLAQLAGLGSAGKLTEITLADGRSVAIVIDPNSEDRANRRGREVPAGRFYCYTIVLAQACADSEANTSRPAYVYRIDPRHLHSRLADAMVLPEGVAVPIGSTSRIAAEDELQELGEALEAAIATSPALATTPALEDFALSSPSPNPYVGSNRGRVGRNVDVLTEDDLRDIAAQFPFEVDLAAVGAVLTDHQIGLIYLGRRWGWGDTEVRDQLCSLLGITD